MENFEDTATLREVGERFIVKKITSSLHASNQLLDGFGHDAAFVELSLPDEYVIVINTDRSGLNIAYQLGLAGAECVGDLGVSHAISDVVAAGGTPKIVTVALLLPEDTEVRFVQEVMRGVEQAATRYGAIVAGGDTKKNPKFTMVVTAIGIAHRNKRLRRSTAQKGDALVVTGHLGSMLLGTISYNKSIDLSSDVREVLNSALVNQRPPFDLGLVFADSGIANACMDISDGLSGTLYSICTASGVGAVIEEAQIPIHPKLRPLAKSMSLRPMQLSLAGGDWQYLYSIPVDNLAEAEKIASGTGTCITVIGQVIESSIIAAHTLEGNYKSLKRIEHDSFLDTLNGKRYFENLGSPQQCFEEIIDDNIIKKFLRL